jgi:hypothetical protein
MPSVVLPLEIWILIIDMLMDPISNPIYDCDYMNFPQIDDSLRHPRLRVVPDDLYWHLRLVCRDFHDIAASPPRLFMRDGQTHIPRGTKAVYIVADFEPLRCFEGLLEDPSRSHRISTLDMNCADNSEGISSFDFLCKNAHLLRGVRNLALGISTSDEVSLDVGVWEGINEAFPNLVSLVLRPSANGSVAQAEAMGEERKVTFNQLEVLEVDHVPLYLGLTLPLLRHVALGCWYQQVVAVLSRSPLLESLLVRKLLYGGGTDRIDPSPLKTLKLLGIPIYEEHMVPPLPPDYPLCHLCAHIPGFVGAPTLVEWVKKMPSCLPHLSRITLDVTAYDRRSSIESSFHCINPELRPSGLFIKPLALAPTFIIAERIVEDSEVIPVP